MLTLDTNVLIYFLGGDAKVSRELELRRLEGEEFLVSTLVQMELLSLPRLTTKEIEHIESLLATMTLVPVDVSLARLAAEFRRQYRLKLADAVIAATAFLRDAPLVTRNTGDFKRVKEIELRRV